MLVHPVVGRHAVARSRPEELTPVPRPCFGRREARTGRVAAPRRRDTARWCGGVMRCWGSAFSSERNIRSLDSRGAGRLLPFGGRERGGQRTSGSRCGFASRDLHDREDEADVQHGLFSPHTVSVRRATGTIPDRSTATATSARNAPRHPPRAPTLQHLGPGGPSPSVGARYEFRPQRSEMAGRSRRAGQRATNVVEPAPGGQELRLAASRWSTTARHKKRWASPPTPSRSRTDHDRTSDDPLGPPEVMAVLVRGGPITVPRGSDQARQRRGCCSRPTRAQSCGCRAGAQKRRRGSIETCRPCGEGVDKVCAAQATVWASGAVLNDCFWQSAKRRLRRHFAGGQHARSSAPCRAEEGWILPKSTRPWWTKPTRWRKRTASTRAARERRGCGTSADAVHVNAARGVEHHGAAANDAKGKWWTCTTRRGLFFRCGEWPRTPGGPRAGTRAGGVGHVCAEAAGLSLH